ncbi:MAG TPA: hypothetical protein VHR47_10805 [Bacillota bacterium]|nr:hypothetical protein [Bacillota bacterium]
MQRLLIAANLQFDRPLTGYLPSARQQRRQESLLSLRKILDEAVSRRVDGVIIAGNLLFTPYPSGPAWEAVKEGSAAFKDAGIPLLLLAGDHDDGPFYQNPSLLEETKLLTAGTSMEFLPGLTVTVGTQPPNGGGILLWRGKESPPSIEGTLTIVMGANWQKGEDNRTLIPGAPIRLDFDEPDEPSISLLSWDWGPSSIEQIAIPDRIYASVRWDVEERGTDIVPYLETRLDGEMALRLLLFGEIDAVIPIDELEKKFKSGYFHLKIIDQTNPSTKAISSSPLVNDTFSKLISNALRNLELSPNDVKQYYRAWVLGQNAFKGGEKRAD